MSESKMSIRGGSGYNFISFDIRWPVVVDKRITVVKKLNMNDLTFKESFAHMDWFIEVRERADDEILFTLKLPDDNVMKSWNIHIVTEAMKRRRETISPSINVKETHWHLEFTSNNKDEFLWVSIDVKRDEQ